MVKNIFILLIMSSFSIEAQVTIEGIILDVEDKKPIEFVDVFSDSGYTYSNENGKFSLRTSKDDPITFKVLGYQKLRKELIDLTKNDTVFLQPNIYQLDEVVVSNNDPPVIKMFRAIKHNYPIVPFKERFFLRSVLEKNDQIQELQDIYGIVERQILLATSQNPRPKKNYRFSVNQMRKAGIKDKLIDINTPGIEYVFDRFVSIYVSPERYEFTPRIAKDSLTTKFFFQPKDETSSSTTGYYLMANKDSALVEVIIKNPNPDPKGDKKSNFTYRTTNYEVHAFFSKDDALKSYHLKKARLDLSMEVEFENGQIDNYQSYFILSSTPYFTEEKIKNNVSLNRDLFELDAPYNPSFWENQNSLRLSDALNDFLEKIQDITGKKGFKTVSNID